MGESRKRLRRYLADELQECHAEDVDRRLDELARLQGVVDSNRVDEHVSALSALANDTRYRLVRSLVAAEGELCVCELHPLVDVSESGVSHAMSTLVDAGLAIRRKNGKWRKYESTDLAERMIAALGGGDES